jgi:hypothetical protein
MMRDSQCAHFAARDPLGLKTGSVRNVMWLNFREIPGRIRARSDARDGSIADLKRALRYREALRGDAPARGVIRDGGTLESRASRGGKPK